ncbi:MAG: carbohydrate binding domain-containing protein [Lachnospiraceae bacterium]|nr:carbohydrate binding domain-containing protein [Lachnospiraceae bacterium]
MDKIFKSQRRLKKYNLNRLAAWLLAVLMFFSALPTGSMTVQAGAMDGNVAQIVGGNSYTSLELAIDAANDNDIIMLLDNIDLGAEASIAPNKAITIDLNGRFLKAYAFNAYGKTKIIDGSESKTGVLKVTNFIPAADNGQMPVYNDTDGYMFATMVEQVERISKVGDDTFKLIFKPYFGTTAMNKLLEKGGKTAQVSICIRLEWTDEEGNTQSKELEYADEMVKEVYAGKNKAFYIEASGATQFDNLTITPLVKSNMGEYPKWSNSCFEAGKEFILTGGFEEGWNSKDDLPNGTWKRDGASHTGIDWKLELDTTEFKSGTASLRVNISSADVQENRRGVGVYYPVNSGLTGGKWYTISAYVKVEGDTYAEIYVQPKAGKTNLDKIYIEEKLENTNGEWVHISKTFKLDDTATKATFFFRNATIDGKAGTVYFDDVSLITATEPSEPVTLVPAE